MAWNRRRKTTRQTTGYTGASRIGKNLKKKQEKTEQIKPVSTYSDFWLDDDYLDTNLWGSWEDDDSKTDEEKDQQIGMATLVRLSGVKNSIANFVQILTGKSIPVKFHTEDSSYTDGKTVTITGNVLNESFDVTVGLALHEGSHIHLTDFDSIKDRGELISEMKKYTLTEQVSKKDLLKSMYNIFGKKRSSLYETMAPLVESQIQEHIERMVKYEIIWKGMGLGSFVDDGHGIHYYGGDTAYTVYSKLKTKLPASVKDLLKPSVVNTKAYKELRKSYRSSHKYGDILNEIYSAGMLPFAVKNKFSVDKWDDAELDRVSSLVGRIFSISFRMYDGVYSKTGHKNKLSRAGKRMKKFGAIFNEKDIDGLWKIHATTTDTAHFNKVMDFVKQSGLINIFNYVILTNLLIQVMHTTHNWIEDRRIDNYVYDSAPGYRGYYESMYDYYFLSEKISKELKKNKAYKSETWSSYEFRLINLLNKDCKLDSLKGLRDIWNTIDLKNIKTWAKNSGDTYEKAMTVLDIIFNNIKRFEIKFEGVGDGVGNTKGNGGGMSDLIDTSDYTETGEDGEGKKQTAKELSKQRDFINNDVKKSKLSDAVITRIDQVGSFDASIQMVGQSIEQYGNIYGAPPRRGVECIVIKKITPTVVETSGLHCFSSSYYVRDNERSVQSGINKGYVLGRKLQLRNEERSTIFNRKKQGKIDKRLINSLGYNNEGVFFNEIIDKYKNTHLHLTIDNSGSMGGDKFQNALECAVAIAKAAEMCSNIEVVISFRYSEDIPILVVAHDSRIQKLNQSLWGLKQIHPAGCTPEGLTFEVIQDIIPTASTALDVYFVNFSDGEPAYSTSGFSYYGEPAHKHTSQQVKLMTERGIKVISYFIENYHGSYGWDHFKTMYTKWAEQIDTQNIFQVARSLNKRFLDKVA